MLTKSTAWKALEDHQKNMRDVSLRDLFADDPERGRRMTAEAAGVFLDYSKNRITDETLKLLCDLAEESGLRARIDAMFRGEKINVTEGSGRAARRAACARRAKRFRSTARTSCPKCTPCSTRWPLFRAASATATGKATPASASATSSISASAAPTSGPVMAYEALQALQRPRPDVPLRLQRRRHRPRRGDPRSRPGRDAVHRRRRRRSRRWRR